MPELGFGKIAEGAAKVATNIIDGLAATLGKGQTGSPKYPSKINSVDISKFTNIPNFRDGGWKESRGYGFQVHRVKSGGSVLKAAEGFEEFRLQINPQELSQDEIFAIEVTPTFRGVIVEHHGQILKDIVISGTTGKSPLAREGGVVRATGRPVVASGHSGYEEFHEFRSYIRAYVEAKRVDKKDGGELRLVFNNFKDNEFLFVEPQKFTMKRTAQKSILYEYNLQLKAIGVAGAPNKANDDGYGLIGSVIDVINIATDLISQAGSIVAASAGIIRRFEQDLVNTILGPLNALETALNTAKVQGKSSFEYTRRSLESFKTTINGVVNNMADGLGRDMTAYNDVANRTPTLVGVSGRESTFQELRAFNGLQKAKRGLSILLSEDSLFAKDMSEANAEIEDIFNGKISLPAPNSTRSVIIDGQDNIQILSARELGDINRFKEIVILNNLKPPYIDPAGGEGVLRPGERILVPQSSEQESTGVKRNKEYEITRFLSESEKNLGVDIMLDKNNDLAVSNTNDLDLIAGVPNFSQALLIIISLEPGDLKRHPEIGLGIETGTKITTKKLADSRRRFISSLASDLRVSSVPFIELIQDGNGTIINAVVNMKNLDQPVPLPLRVTDAA